MKRNSYSLSALILTGLGYMKYKTQKAAEQQDEFEAKGEMMEKRFSEVVNESDSGKNWMNGTYVQMLLIDDIWQGLFSR